MWRWRSSSPTASRAPHRPASTEPPGSQLVGGPRRRLLALVLPLHRRHSHAAVSAASGPTQMNVESSTSSGLGPAPPSAGAVRRGGSGLHSSAHTQSSPGWCGRRCKGPEQPHGCRMGARRGDRPHRCCRVQREGISPSWIILQLAAESGGGCSPSASLGSGSPSALAGSGNRSLVDPTMLVDPSTLEHLARAQREAARPPRSSSSPRRASMLGRALGGGLAWCARPPPAAARDDAPISVSSFWLAHVLVGQRPLAAAVAHRFVLFWMGQTATRCSCEAYLLEDFLSHIKSQTSLRTSGHGSTFTSPPGNTCSSPRTPSSRMSSSGC